MSPASPAALTPVLSERVPPSARSSQLARVSARQVSACVQRQVVGARERPIAVVALERLGAGVLAQVPRQLVGPREPPAAVGVRAAERTLACATPHTNVAVVNVTIWAPAHRGKLGQLTPLENG